MSNDSNTPEVSDQDTPLSKAASEPSDADFWDLGDSASTPAQKIAPAQTAAETSIGSPKEIPQVTASPDSTKKTNSPLFFTKLSKIELLAIAGLIALLLIGSITSIVIFNKTIDLEPLIAGELALPIKGEKVSVTAVETYWREPITRGENSDIFRRGTKLLPVIKLKTEGSSGVLRFLFRDSEGLFVGDNINHRVSGNEELEIAATAGFNDTGMHSGYRTGDTGRWTVEILEGPSARAPLEKFKILFKAEIDSTIK